MFRRVEIFILIIIVLFVLFYKDFHLLNKSQIVEKSKKDISVIINKMEDSNLKSKLLSCSENPLKKNNFTIGHRGARLKYPEHTKESYEAAAFMGAGMVECDITFTKDKELVCRHSQCDLHLTTNILSIPDLAEKCTQPFSKATFDIDGNLLKSASAKCCTTDITLEEFKKLSGKIESQNKEAQTVEEYMKINKELYSNVYLEKGMLMTHLESIKLLQSLGVKMIPEIKKAQVSMPYKGTFSQDDYVQKVVDEYKSLGVNSKDIYIQTSNLNDILYLVSHEKKLSKQSVFLYSKDKDALESFLNQGVNYIASPIWKLLTLKENKIVPSDYAKEASVKSRIKSYIMDV